MPRRRTRVFRSRSGGRCTRASNVSPSIGPDHIDGVAHVGTSGALPDHLGVARRLAVGRIRKQPVHPVPHRQHRHGGDGDNEHPGQGRRKPAAPTAASYKYLFSRMGTYPELRAESGQSGKALASKIRGDAFALPVAIAGRFRALRTLKLLLLRGGAGIGGFAARLGFGERTLGGRRQLACVPCRRVMRNCRSSQTPIAQG